MFLDNAGREVANEDPQCGLYIRSRQKVHKRISPCRRIHAGRIKYHAIVCCNVEAAARGKTKGFAFILLISCLFRCDLISRLPRANHAAPNARRVLLLLHLLVLRRRSASFRSVSVRFCFASFEFGSFSSRSGSSHIDSIKSGSVRFGSGFGCLGGSFRDSLRRPTNADDSRTTSGSA